MHTDQLRFTLKRQLPLTWLILGLVGLLWIGTGSVHAQAGTPRTVYLPLAISGQADPGPQPGGSTSEALITLAQQRGEIDEETALLYRVYAAFNDPRLPAVYRGDDSADLPTLAVHEAQARLSTLKAETQAALAPLLLPPTAEASWLEQQAGAQAASVDAKIVWETACKTDTNIKVWYQARYPEDAADAAKICDLVVGEIWPRLTSLMGRKPASDSAENNNGGDERLDFYMVNARTGSVGYRGCDNTPSYIYVNRSGWGKATLTEAVMGALMDGYDTADCLEYMWLYAATRTWSVDYVYPDHQYEHMYADDFLNHTELSLNTYPIVPLEEQNAIGDGAYLWVWYATNMTGLEARTIVPAWWEAATNPNSLAAVNMAMGERGFENDWDEFSTLNWNHQPVDVYADLDGLAAHTKPKQDVAVTLDNGANSYPLDGEVNYLAAHTYRFTFDSPDMRSLLFINPYAGGVEPTATVDAILTMADGSLRLEDWSGSPGKILCRDFVAERVSELVIVISNHEWENRAHKLQPAYPPRLNVTNVACRGWKFEGTASHHETGQELDVQESATAEAVYMRMGDYTQGGSLVAFQATEGSVAWTHSGHHVNCGGSGSARFDVTGGAMAMMIMHALATDRATATTYVPGDRAYMGYGMESEVDFALRSVRWECSDSSFDRPVAVAGNWFKTELVPTQQISADGTTITGSYTTVDTVVNGSTTTNTWEWTMTALPPE